ncbi:MAG: tetratricopeptide repeat protein [Tepidisphaeraceae bacterium]|jgi:predicted O-linked N-acetylglucosamine transferase (SPINDLY family)
MQQSSIQQTFDAALRLHRLGQDAEAGSLCRQVLAQQPGHADAMQLLAAAECNQGIALMASGKTDEAVAAFGRAVAARSEMAEAHNYLGNALQAKGDWEGAMGCYRRALALRPDYASAHNNLGVALQHRGRLDEAVAAFRQAVAVQGDFVAALNNLGGLLAAKNQPDEAIPLLRRAVQLWPDSVAAHINLGTALQQAGQIDQAIAEFRAVLLLRPDFADGHNNLANAHKEIAQWPAAIAAYRRAVELQPDNAALHSNLIGALNYAQDDPAALRRELEIWNQRHARPLRGQICPHDNDPSPQRRLRIGYVSADFRFHPVGRFLAPLLAHHDHGPFEIFCYGDVQHADEMTGRLRSACDVWRDIRGGSDEQVAELIRQDRIDVLVDLSLHTGGNRLLVFARKPAPVQVTYLAYCGTSGLETMDYRLTDPYLDPPGMDESAYSEKSVRLRTYWCYEPCIAEIEVGQPPALASGRVTFGCFNNYCKVSPGTWRAWRRLLQAVPGSGLVVYCPFGSHRDRLAGELTAAGLDADRLTLVSAAPTAAYFEQYRRIDIALDPFPFCGGTTTCDALWMGVPVVTLAGATAVGRGGVSILSNVGFGELVAQSVEQYVEIAAALAGDPRRLAELRSGLRARMQRSPLMDAGRFAKDVESAYREMWRRWCKSKA